jgi:signal peptidase II
MTPDRRKYVVFGVLAALTVIIDQWTKVLARQVLKPLGYGQSKVVIENYFNLRYSENTGVAFGMFQNLSGGRIVLTLVALAALVLVLYLLRKTTPDQRRLHVALGLVGGGAIGNLSDRIRFGRVTDFIVWHYHGLEWPAFNIADAALVVGVGLMAIDTFRKPTAAAAPNPGAPAGTKDA